SSPVRPPRACSSLAAGTLVQRRLPMNVHRTSPRMPVLGALLAVLVSGCAGLPTPGTRLDPTQLGNAIVSDHVEYVRAAIEARVASVNERVPAPVYAEGTPLITIAARAGAVNVVRYLIDVGADINARTPAAETA